MTTVRDYFEERFENHPYEKLRDSHDLHSMPLDSTCGDACKVAIDNAKALDDLIRDGHGPYYPNHNAETRAIANIAVNLCGLYICG